MRNDGVNEQRKGETRDRQAKGVPAPTTAFRRRAWLEFQRAIDPLAPPKPLKIGRR